MLSALIASSLITPHLVAISATSLVRNDLIVVGAAIALIRSRIGMPGGETLLAIAEDAAGVGSGSGTNVIEDDAQATDTTKTIATLESAAGVVMTRASGVDGAAIAGISGASGVGLGTNRAGINKASNLKETRSEGIYFYE